MRIREIFNFPNAPAEYSQEYVNQVLSSLEQAFSEIARGVNGGLGFGDGTDLDNLVGKWLSYSTNGVANTEDEITHDLGVVPIGFIVLVPPRSGVINRGPTSWTSSKMYLQCSAASQTATIFAIIASQQTD